MGVPARLLVVAPAIVTLAFLAVVSARWGMADSLTYAANNQINTWLARRIAPPAERWETVREELVEAETLAAADPQPPELLAALFLHAAGRNDQAAQALAPLRRALELRPSSPYTWANLVDAYYRLGMTAGPFGRILSMAHRLGPSEPEVQRLVVDVGLAMWDELGSETRAAVESAVAAGVKRNPLEILQISERRGRLSMACALAAGDKRLERTKWIKTCSREAR